LDKKNSSLLLGIFKPFITVEEFMMRILNLLDGAKDHVSVLEKEYLYRYHNAFNQLINLNKTKNYFRNIKTIYQFYKRIIANEKNIFSR
jgi:hypothetical protein